MVISRILSIYFLFRYAYEEDTGMDDEMAEAFEKFLMMQDALK
jgi:hypothetical protein